LLQLDAALLDAVHAQGFEVAVETNGTLAPPPGIDWICVSPKAEAELALRQGDELKLVFPQAGSDPDALERLHFDHFWVQPMDGPALAENTRAAVAFCLERPIWRLSLQTHKFIGIP
jgi:organic radical activating enzyme